MDKKKCFSLFQALGLDHPDFNNLAKATRFKSRFRSLAAFDFLFTLLVSCTQHCVSYNNMARNLCSRGDRSVSKQALQKAMTHKRFLLFIKMIFKRILIEKLKKTDTSLWQHTLFKRILVQDSTVIKLPRRLFDLFSGVSNGLVQVANARIQFAFDLLNEQVVYFSVDPYRLNDIKKARCLTVNAGDLVLRDRGYLSAAEIKRIVGVQADFIYRYKHGLLYLDLRTGKPIALLKMLRRNPRLDMMVRLSDRQGPVVRLVATAVNEELANRRRQKLKKEAHGKPGKECLALLSWSIFITSIKPELMDYKAVQQLYTLRWRVEILFKVMKSNLRLDKIHTVPAPQLYFIIYAKLIFLLLITRFIYLPARKIIKKRFNKEISISKLSAYLTENPTAIIDIIQELLVCLPQSHHKLNSLARYCCYDKRKRTNFHQSAMHILLS